MKSLTLLLLLACLALPAAAQEAPPLLPAEFAGWTMQGSARVSDQARAADSAYAAVLEEYGFRRLEEAAYTRGDRRIAVRAASFQDATGAYGAFTFYKRPNMHTEQVGEQGASAGQNRVLFYRGNILVEAEMDRLTAMTAAELRELASALPVAPGPEQRLPTLPTYLPQRDYIPHTAKFAHGPRALAYINAPLPAQVVDFERGAEAVLARYQTTAGIADLMIVAYPTPQIAAERLAAVEDYIYKLRTEQPDAMPVQFVSRRSGPLVIVLAGDAAASEARALVSAISYDAAVTWSERVPTQRDNVGSLVLAAFTLAAIMLAATLIVGVVFGGFRVLFFKLFPRLRRSDEEDFIALDISRTRGGGPR
jgi:hypothetical protein